LSKIIEIYTDGSSKGNPGKGGYGVIMCFNGKCKEFSQGFRLTTNNRMELMAVVVALENLKTKEYPIKIFSDSKYVIDSITKKWVFSWLKKGFKGKKNEDLWRQYLKVQKDYKIEFVWVKGHNGHPQNERCDFLAVSASDVSPLKIDEYYENNKNESSSDDLF
jgi:ribonuclease HI